MLCVASRLSNTADLLHRRVAVYWSGYHQIHRMCLSSDYSFRRTTTGLSATEQTSLDSYNQIRCYSGDGGSTALTLLRDLKHLKSSPMPALVLGVSGLIPFIAAPAYMAMSGSFIASLAYSQVAYGAVALSFVGAVRWGMALSENGIVRPNWFNLGYSVTPCLVAWVALMLPTTLSLMTLIFGLGGATYMDITMFGYPSWFKALRFLISFIAILSLWTVLVFKFILSDSNRKQTKIETIDVKEAKREMEEANRGVTEAIKEMVKEVKEAKKEAKEEDMEMAEVAVEEIKQLPGGTTHGT